MAPKVLKVSEVPLNGSAVLSLTATTAELLIGTEAGRQGLAIRAERFPHHEFARRLQGLPTTSGEPGVRQVPQRHGSVSAAAKCSTVGGERQGVHGVGKVGHGRA